MSKRTWFPLQRMWIAGLLIAAAAVGGGLAKRGFTMRDKAYYADDRTLNFVRPGLAFKVLSAAIATDGTITAKVRVTDLLGVPLDRTGVLTPGAVSMSLIAAYLPANATQYVSYTTRVQTSPITNVAATQAGADSGGTWAQTADGEYQYTFRTKAPSGFDATATHTIGVYGSRNLSEFDLGTNYASTTYNFIPAGGTVTKVRDVVGNQGCNGCHTVVSAHGGSRRGVEMCVLCHTPQTVDPDTGNTVDMVVMTHKIHMGKELPSVAAGGTYKIIGNQQSVHDFSKVGFPAGIRACDTCHVQEGTGATTQATAMFVPNRAACGACHDNIDFAKGVGHNVQLDDTRCSQCHRPDGEREWDISVKGAHTIPERSKNLHGIKVEIIEVRNTLAGQQPVVTYKLSDATTGTALVPTDLNSISILLSGPAADYSTYTSEAARTDPQNPSGTSTHTFAKAIPADAKGTFSVSFEGYRNVTFEGPSRIPTTVRDPIKNVVSYFDVQGNTATPRRTVVALNKCNTCHVQLEAHGRNRNQIEHCVECHNPTLTDSARRPAAQGPPESVSFATMIHRLHTATTQGRPYVIYGFGGSANDFSDVALPTDANNCSVCHVGTTFQLPLQSGLQSINDPRGWLTTPGAATAACLSCHTSKEAAAHAQLNTSPLGESCTVCHGPNSDYAVSKVHAK